MRKLILALAVSAVAAVPTISMADNSGVMCEKVKPTIENIRANLHANYMPNYIPVLTNSQEALSLSGDQCAAINKFRKEKASKGALIVKDINKLEKEAYQAAFDGASMDDIMKRNTEIQSLRTKITQGKMKCHGFVKKLLSDEQYKKLNKMMVKKKQEVDALLAGK